MNIKRIINKLKRFYAQSSGERMLAYYKKKGIKIGAGTKIFDPKRITLDASRPELLEIGEHVNFNSGVTIMTHDWASWCFLDSDAEFIPSHAKVKIGNNVWMGRDVTICKGVTIGDNCIIGIASVVTKSIPANSVAAGVPAKVICSYNDYLRKRSEQYVNETIEYARAIIDSGREPHVEDFYDDYPCFVDGDNFQDYDFPYLNVFSAEQFEQWKKQHKKVFNGFEDFINSVKEQYPR